MFYILISYCSNLKEFLHSYDLFCELEKKTTLHIFYECTETETILQQLHSLCNDSFSTNRLVPYFQMYVCH